MNKNVINKKLDLQIHKLLKIASSMMFQKKMQKSSTLVIMM